MSVHSPALWSALEHALGAAEAKEFATPSEIATDGTVEASSFVKTDANKDVTGFRNVTATGTVQGATVTATGTVNGADITATDVLTGNTIVGTVSIDTPLVTNDTLVLESLNPLTIELNDVASLTMDNAAITSAAAASTAAQDVFLKTHNGGAAAADAHGVDGGDLTITAGSGSAGGAHTAANPNGGNAGNLLLAAGAGGAAGSGGSGVAGDPGKIKASVGVVHFCNAQTIDMADAEVKLTLNPGTPVGTLITSNVLAVDANSGGTEDLLLPPEADCNGLTLFICNTGGEDIVVKEDSDTTTICTISTAESAFVACDGTTWRGGVVKAT